MYAKPLQPKEDEGKPQRTGTRQDVFLGLVGETPQGVITIGPAIGDGGRYKLVFTLGKLF